MNHIPDYVRPGGKSYVSPEGIIYCTDGKLRWVYEIDQRKQPTVLLRLLRNYVALALVVGVLGLCLGPQETAFAAVTTQLALVGVAVAVSLVMFGVRLLEHGRYICQVYTMDEQTISCQQIKGKTNKEQVVHAFAVWVGGQSQPAVRTCALRQTPVDCVRTLAVNRSGNRIRLGGGKGLRAVFVESEQLPLVLDHLKQYCPGASTK